MHSEQHHAPRSLVIAAFAAVYIVWGSTYLAIRVAVETMPPFLMAGVRFLIAGAALLALVRLRGVPWPERRHLRPAAITGILLLLGGNGLTVWAEQEVPSSLAALIVAIVPAWMALLDWLRPGGHRPPAQTIFGILVGFGGVSLLVLGSGHNAMHLTVSGTVALVLACLFWSAGSLHSKHSERIPNPWMNTAVQMLFGGIALTAVALARGEQSHFRWEAVSVRSIVAFAYLVVFGSWVAFCAYVWLLRVSTPAKVATYAYVNPLIAVLLGWAILGEQLSARALWASLVIVTGVIIITLPPVQTWKLRARKTMG